MIERLPKRIYHQFPALKYKNYRLYFFGQLISFSGSWLQGIAFGWLVYQLTQSAFWLGAVSAISAFPVLALSLYGGFLVDNFDRKKLLFITQSAALICAFILGLLTITKLITLPILLVLTLLSGIANAIDNPVTQAFVVDVVGKDDLPSAVGLNSTIFNAGRVLGPAAGGFLIALVGIGNIFLINAASFLAILISLYFIKVNCPRLPKSKVKSVTAIKQGLVYSYSHPVISMLLLTAGIGSIFCFSQATIMPMLAARIFQQGSSGLGSLLSSMGLGALLASVFISSQSKRISSIWIIISGNVLFILSMLTFSFVSDLRLAMICLFIAGLGLTLQFSTVYSTIQRLVAEEYRGRVSSLYVMLFVGFSPLGNLFIGTTAGWYGPMSAIRISSLATLLYGVFILLNLPRVKKKYLNYNRIINPAYSTS